jgi:uncharacterized repeat protein (TIGR01451 family)
MKKNYNYFKKESIMKITKLLLGMLIVAIAVPAFASQIQATKATDPVSPNVYHLGDTIDYVMTVENPSDNPATNTLTRIWDTLPDGTVIEYLTGGDTLVQAPGDVDTFTASYVVALADIIWIPALDSYGVRNKFEAEGYDDAGDDVYALVTRNSRVIKPAIEITKSASPEAICEGEPTDVTYTYLVNWGVGADADLYDVVVTDVDCPPVRGPDDPGDNDDVLEEGEVWVYTCTTPISAETTNLVDVVAVDELGQQVTDDDEYTVLVNPPPEVSVDPAEVAICELDEVTLCAVVTPDTGTPPFTYSWTKDGVPMEGETGECITVSEAGEYCVTVVDDAGCEDTACGTVTVIPQPDCSIEGPTSICEEDIDIPVEICTPVVADNYEWEVMDGPGTIPGAYDLPCVDLVPTGLGTIVLELRVWNDVPPDGSCGNSCQIEILVEECGGGYCTFTPGFYGNEGGKACGGMTTTEIINAVLGDGVLVGVLGERSILFDGAACIISRLPAGGKPRPLPAGLGDAHCDDDLPGSLVKKKDPRINNTLVGHTVALTLNMRLDTIPCMDEEGFEQALGDYTFPEADYICVQQGDGCIMRHEIPESLQGLSVAALLEVANMALAGDKDLVAGAYEGASFVNELFDECWTIVACPVDPVEICGDGCDNDFDGAADCDDIDCCGTEGCEPCPD